MYPTIQSSNMVIVIPHVTHIEAFIHIPNLTSSIFSHGLLKSPIGKDGFVRCWWGWYCKILALYFDGGIAETGPRGTCWWRNGNKDIFRLSFFQCDVVTVCMRSKTISNLVHISWYDHIRKEFEEIAQAHFEEKMGWLSLITDVEK